MARPPPGQVALVLDPGDGADRRRTRCRPRHEEDSPSVGLERALGGVRASGDSIARVTTIWGKHDPGGQRQQRQVRRFGLWGVDPSSGVLRFRCDYTITDAQPTGTPPPFPSGRQHFGARDRGTGQRSEPRQERAAASRVSRLAASDELRRGACASIASTIPGSSGVTCGRKRATTLPSGDTRNFSKFHFTSPASPSASASCGELLVDRVAVGAVHVDLLEQRERDAVGGVAELADLLGACPAPGP